MRILKHCASVHIAYLSDYEAWICIFKLICANLFFLLQGIVSPHDLAVSQNGDTLYVVEVPLDRQNQKIYKYDVINNNPDQGLFWICKLPSNQSSIIPPYLE